ncbi:MAG: methyltransferase [Clostridia bacterium]|nr:methyltransferase [Clostridia bacterium]
MDQIVLENDERLDDLEYKGLKIIQKPDLYCFSSDAVLLANLVRATSKDSIVDFGCGSGVITILALAKTNAKNAIGFEIQEKMANLAKKNTEINNLQEKIEIINDDIKNASKHLGKESVKVVVCNPPYFKSTSGEVSNISEVALSRTESTATLVDIAKSAAEILKYSGKFYMIHKSERLAEVLTCLSNNKLEPKKLTMIYPKASKAVDTFIVEAQKNGAPGLTIDSVIVYEEDGTMTPWAKKLYNKE